MIKLKESVQKDSFNGKEAKTGAKCQKIAATFQNFEVYGDLVKYISGSS